MFENKNAYFRCSKSRIHNNSDFIPASWETSAAFTGVQFGRLYYRQLDIEKNLSLKLNKGNYDHTMSFSDRARSDLKWWLENIDTSFEEASLSPPSLIVTCDACKTGWGGWSGISQTKGKFSLEETNLHINEKELLAVLFSLQSLMKDTQGQVIKVL